MNASDIHSSVEGLAKNKFAQEFSDTYTMAVGEARQREIVLRLMARWDLHDIPLSEIYAMARKLGVVNPSQHKKDLSRKKYGELLLSPQKGIVRFRNALLKRYVDLRSAIFVGSTDQSSLRDEINAVFDSHAAPTKRITKN
jgi:hypothetical protein